MNDPEATNGERQKARRRLMKSVAASGIGLSTLPSQWSKPVMDSVLLPAHAQTTTSEDDNGSGPTSRAYRTAGNIIVGLGNGSFYEGYAEQNRPGELSPTLLQDNLLDFLVPEAHAAVGMLHRKIVTFTLSVLLPPALPTGDDTAEVRMCFHFSAKQDGDGDLDDYTDGETDGFEAFSGGCNQEVLTAIDKDGAIESRTIQIGGNAFHSIELVEVLFDSVSNLVEGQIRLNDGDGTSDDNDDYGIGGFGPAPSFEATADSGYSCNSPNCGFADITPR